VNPDALQQFAVVAQALSAAQQRVAALRAIFATQAPRTHVDDVLVQALREPIDALAASVAELAAIQHSPPPRKDP
jgi:hypothetical protein